MTERAELTDLLKLYRQKVERRYAASLKGDRATVKLEDANIELAAKEIGNLLEASS